MVELKLEYGTGVKWIVRRSLEVWEDESRSLESILELESELAEIAWTGKAISRYELGLYPGFILRIEWRPTYGVGSVSWWWFGS